MRGASSMMKGEKDMNAEEKLEKIKEVVRAYVYGEEPYGDDPEIGAPTAMSEVIAIVQGRESPIEADKRQWCAMGKEAEASIGRLMIDGIRNAEVKVLWVVERDDAGVLVKVEVMRYLVKAHGYEVDRRKELPVGSMYEIGFGVLETMESARYVREPGERLRLEFDRD